MAVDRTISLSKEPLNWGLSIFAPVSSAAGSSSLIFTQPLLTGNVFTSPAVLIGAELFLLIAKLVFGMKSIPMLDLKNGKTGQMPISELQKSLPWMSNGLGSSPNPNSEELGNEGEISSGETAGSVLNRGFPTPESPEAPLVVAIYVQAVYSNKTYSPDVWLFIPIVTFPGIRGALPLLILGLLGTIFVRDVVTPDTTGSKPLTSVSQ